MDRVYKYLQQYKNDLIRDYHTYLNGNHRDCFSIGDDICDFLVGQGLSTFKLGVNVKSGIIMPRLSIALDSNGWGFHSFPCAENLAFDPLNGKPIFISEYINKTFQSIGKMYLVGIISKYSNWEKPIIKPNWVQ